MADGYARVTGQPQAVIVHVDVGTQALSCAMHNAHIARSPVLIFAGLCPSTMDGELRGSRTEFINFLQDVFDQPAIVRQYCRYANEIRTPTNVKQMVARALQFATSAPKGPAYLCAAREVFEAEMEPYQLDQRVWRPVGLSGLPTAAIEEISDALLAAEEPLVITGYVGRNFKAVGELAGLADIIKSLRVVDMSIGDMCFPADHPAWLGGKYSAHDSIETADVILVLDCDVPWVPTQCRPRKDAKIYHVDVDPLKTYTPLYYIDAIGRWKVDAYTALTQLITYMKSSAVPQKLLANASSETRATLRLNSYSHTLNQITIAATPKSGPSTPLNPSLLTALLKRHCPSDTIWAVEAVTNTMPIYDQLQCTTPGSYMSSGAGGLGWAGGASLGIKLALDTQASSSTSPSHRINKGTFVTQIIGDGCFVFSHPETVYWISQAYSIPLLVIILNNNGWNAPRKSLHLVHPAGEGSQISNLDLNIGFNRPSPDYPGIARAASAGSIGTGYANTWADLDEILPEAVRTVKSGTSYVIDCKIPPMKPNTKDGVPEKVEVKAEMMIANHMAERDQEGKVRNGAGAGNAGNKMKRKFDDVSEEESLERIKRVNGNAKEDGTARSGSG
ncbi:putative acetolactate synthase [Phaeomoniella chlamydospora]|uniref:Putative acetolactate synthase n=1 Tax=Phaeomoniella chlamydospora TaxID=158046 RepID=A0A0G2EMV5_PHACM|nr:putative acetolactate synthase [Phaeomoniella chlamydospora]